ncbi:hypothetical protein [Candidatus Palauibacter sp.]|uniref:hypothetical protein n=1 Tax=Candidatus Palauibacter sp. TaxID=3101350 RepID=UPI003B027C7C
MPGLQFKIADLLREARDFKGIAASFLDRNTAWQLDQFTNSLTGTQSATTTHFKPLELEDLWTIPTRQYDRHPGQPVRACISGIWEIARAEPQPSGLGDKRKRAKKNSQVIAFSGKASMRITIHKADSAEGVKIPPPVGDGSDGIEGDRHDRVAMWRIECGALDGPGSYFHMQVLGDEPDPPFPKWLPVPRLPSLFSTPMAAIEFCLGELFQDQWAKEVAASQSPAESWRSRQGERLGYLLHWLRCEAMLKGSSSPWVNLKDAVPPDDLFVRERNTCEACNGKWASARVDPLRTGS